VGFWSKAKAAISRIIPRKRARPVEPPPTPPPVAPLQPTHPHREPERTPRSLDGLVDALYAIGVAAGGTHDAANIHELEEALGNPGARTLLRNQLQSTRAWMRGNPGIGNTRWQARAEYMMAHLRDGKSMPHDIDVFFYYHGKKKN